MDGYAVCYADVQSCSMDAPVALQVIEEIPAGAAPQQTVAVGQAARILTGSMMPAGADTVVMQEDARREGDRVIILAAPPQRGAFVRSQGTYYRAGNPLLTAGTVLNAPEMAVLAAAQVPWVKVIRQPRVAILSTGNELVELDQCPQPGQIVDSNRYALEALIAQAGATAVPLGIVKDDVDTLRGAIEEAVSRCDVVLSSGGVSVGDYDYVEQVLAELGGTIHIRAVAVKPGKPLTVATFDCPDRTTTLGEPLAHTCLYFGLPGNPVSALVTFWRFVQPALRKLAGLPAVRWKLPLIAATSEVELRSDGKRETYVWGQLSLTEGQVVFQPAGGRQVSGDLVNLAGTNGLAVLPQGVTQVAAGARVEVLQVGALLVR